MSLLPAVLIGTALAAVLLQVLTWLVSLRLGRVSVVDVTWGLGFALIAVVGSAVSIGSGDPLRRWLLVVLTVVWGIRLAVHIAARQRGAQEDPRYAEMLGSDAPATAARRRGFLQPAAAAGVISLPGPGGGVGARGTSARGRATRAASSSSNRSVGGRSPGLCRGNRVAAQ